MRHDNQPITTPRQHTRSNALPPLLVTFVKLSPLKLARKMVKLNSLTCTIDSSPPDLPLQEFNPTYGDGFVSTYVLLPPSPGSLSVHLKSLEPVSTGLAVVVFIDGVFQCARHEVSLTGAPLLDVEFRIRQREDRLAGNQFVAREWRFEKISTGETAGRPLPELQAYVAGWPAG